jgi:hypothetical protein
MTSSQPTARVAAMLLAVLLLALPGAAQTRAEISVSGTGFLIDGKPFAYTGLSFFNAIYNPAFNASSSARRDWITKFKKYGINVFRIWCQWDNARGFVDAGPARTLYHQDGRLRADHLRTLKAILSDAADAAVVIELVLFSHESYRENIRLGEEESMRAVKALTEELHHDMFQTVAGSPAVTPSGVPDPEFSPYHRQVFEFIAMGERYQGRQ